MKGNVSSKNIISIESRAIPSLPCLEQLFGAVQLRTETMVGPGGRAADGPGGIQQVDMHQIWLK